MPWVVYRGHNRTSTYLADTVRTIANIVDNFKTGEVYNIGGNQLHSIEALSDLVLKVTKADPRLVQYKDSEILTTRVKKVATGKALQDLGHKDTYDLETGLKLTTEWMADVYRHSIRGKWGNNAETGQHGTVMPP
jgi:dTDP-glucose 4,6-dehydratase